LRASKNYRPEPELVEDEEGHSESSEGIVDHNPFASAVAM